MPSPEQIEAAKTRRGGWTRATLASWGVPWPPPKGWRRILTREHEAQEKGQPFERPHGWNGIVTTRSLFEDAT